MAEQMRRGTNTPCAVDRGHRPAQLALMQLAQPANSNEADSVEDREDAELL